MMNTYDLAVQLRKLKDKFVAIHYGDAALYGKMIRKPDRFIEDRWVVESIEDGDNTRWYFNVTEVIGIITLGINQAGLAESTQIIVLKENLDGDDGFNHDYIRRKVEAQCSQPAKTELQVRIKELEAVIVAKDAELADKVGSLSNSVRFQMRRANELQRSLDDRTQQRDQYKKLSNSRGQLNAQLRHEKELAEDAFGVYQDLVTAISPAIIQWAKTNGVVLEVDDDDHVWPHEACPTCDNMEKSSLFPCEDCESITCGRCNTHYFPK